MGKQHDKIPPLALKVTCRIDGRTQKMLTDTNTYDSTEDESVHLFESHIWKLGSSKNVREDANYLDIGEFCFLILVKFL